MFNSKYHSQIDKKWWNIFRDVPCIKLKDFCKDEVASKKDFKHYPKILNKIITHEKENNNFLVCHNKRLSSMESTKPNLFIDSVKQSVKSRVCFELLVLQKYM